MSEASPIIPDLKGRIYIVTGATSGIGLHTTSHLASHGAHVFLCARTLTRATSAITTIHSLHPTISPEFLEITPLIFDHTRLSTIRPAVNHFISQSTKLHGLVNNAGIMCPPAYAVTEDGYEEQWQVNYLAHYLLTSLLLPTLLATSAAEALATGSPGHDRVRIVNVSSSAHIFAPNNKGIDFENVDLPHASAFTRYAQSKLANHLFTMALHEKYGHGQSSPTTSLTSSAAATAATGASTTSSKLTILENRTAERRESVPLPLPLPSPLSPPSSASTFPVTPSEHAPSPERDGSNSDGSGGGSGRGRIWTATLHPGLVATNLTNVNNTTSEIPLWLRFPVAVAKKLNVGIASPEYASLGAVQLVVGNVVGMNGMEGGGYWQADSSNKARASKGYVGKWAKGERGRKLARELGVWSESEMRMKGLI